jgi:hypothetical protein
MVSSKDFQNTLLKSLIVLTRNPKTCKFAVRRARTSVDRFTKISVSTRRGRIPAMYCYSADDHALLVGNGKQNVFY